PICNYIGITEDAASMFGKLMSISDELMWRYFELLSFRPLAEIARLKREAADGRNPRDIKFELARELVSRFHDAATAERAHRSFIARVSEKAVPDDLPVQAFHVDAAGLKLANLMKAAGLAASSSEANRKIEEGAVRIVGARGQCVDKPLIGAILRAPRSPGREAARAVGLWAFIYGVWVRLAAILRALFPKPQALSGAL